MRKFTFATLSALLASAASAQSSGEIGYQRGALGYDALVSANYSAAEKQILADRTAARGDPAKLINLGTIYLQTNRRDQALVAFNAVLDAEEVELILADGTETSSHDVARRMIREARR